jgi:hypothetical protein
VAPFIFLALTVVADVLLQIILGESRESPKVSKVRKKKKVTLFLAMGLK